MTKDEREIEALKIMLDRDYPSECFRHLTRTPETTRINMTRDQSEKTLNWLLAILAVVCIVGGLIEWLEN